MITQLLLDLLASILAGIIGGLPPLPPGVATAIGDLAAQGAALAPSLAATGPLLPWSEITRILTLFPIALGFWGAVMALRLVLWLVNR